MDPHTINDEWWALLSDTDRDELTTRRPRRGRCYFCHGINHHANGCFMNPTMPWGKHGDQLLSAVPDRYLAFVIDKKLGSDAHQRMFQEELRRRYRTEEGS